MLTAKILSTGLSLLLASPAPEAAAPAPAEVDSVFDMGLDAPPPPPPEPRSDTEVDSVFDMGLDAPPPPPAPVVSPSSPAPKPQGARLAPAPPTKLRQAGWGMLIGGFALASAAGVTFGFSERERSRTRRISLAYDLYGVSPRPLPDDIATTLEESQRNRTRLLVVSAGFAGAAVVAWIVSGVMLGVSRRRRRAERPQARLGVVRF